MLLWQEHAAQHPQQTTYRYSQFCEHYRGYAKKIKRSMRQIHRAGEKLFIDYAGPTVELIDGSRAPTTHKIKARSNRPCRWWSAG